MPTQTVGADCVFARNAGGDVVRVENDSEEDTDEELGSDEEEEEELRPKRLLRK